MRTEGNTEKQNRMKKIIVIGAGAAGLMAACAAADAGARVTVLEHNEKAGKKIYITGKGRCNYSNACGNEEFLTQVLRNPKFLYSALYSFDGDAMTEFLQGNGCPVKEERGKRLFPASDHAFDVTDALVRHLRRKGGSIRFHADVADILTTAEGEACGVALADGQKLTADAVIVATGGRSYPSTGSTGDGYRFAEKLGIAVKEPEPSLVPLTVRETWPLRLQGLALKNVAVTVCRRQPDASGEGQGGQDAAIDAAGDRGGTRSGTKGRKRQRPVYEGFGELLFTHFGLSGPLILSASCHTDFAQRGTEYLLRLDLKPALSLEELENRLRREAELSPKRELRNVLKALLPERLAEEVAGLYAAGKEHLGAESTERRAIRTFGAGERRELAELLKNVPLVLIGTRGFQEAIVTRGGVCVGEVNPSTMESRKVRRLYFAGEVLDVDAYTGGFNLQIAWSTGHLAGASAAATPAGEPAREAAAERTE